MRYENPALLAQFRGCIQPFESPPVGHRFHPRARRLHRLLVMEPETKESQVRRGTPAHQARQIVALFLYLTLWLIRIMSIEDMETKLPICTVGYPVSETGINQEVLFGLKAATPKAVKRKINGFWLGFGGDVEPGDETLKKSFSRELFDETGFQVTPESVEIVAKILIRDEKGDRLWLYYALCKCAREIPIPNREFEEFHWFSKNTLPDKILGADTLILPRIFAGEKLEGYVRYNTDMNVVGYELHTVESIDEALP